MDRDFRGFSNIRCSSVVRVELIRGYFCFVFVDVVIRQNIYFAL